MNHYVLGIDLGGTNIKFGLLDPHGKIVARLNLETRKFVESKACLIDGLVQGCRQILDRNGLSPKNVDGIGIGLPGLVNIKKGTVYSLTNIPGWRNVPLKRIIEKKTGIPTFIDNDVNVIALAEWTFGAGRKRKNILCITLGTGIGGGLILNNALYRGEGFAAGEVGHVPITEERRPCNCGGFGCLETFVGNRYLLSEAQKAFGRAMGLEEITALADAGHEKAKDFWRKTATRIGVGLTGVVNVFNPSCIVVGGGIAKAHQHMFATIRATIKERAMLVQGRMVKIVRSRLGSDAGILGTLVLVRQLLPKK